MNSSNNFKVVLAFFVLMFVCPNMSWADLSVLFYDDFDDGNFNGWTVMDVSGYPDARAPDVVPSPEGYSVRGTGTGYSPDWGNFIAYPIDLQNTVELSIEMRAKSGSNTPNEANTYLHSGQDRYIGRVYGEGNQAADWQRIINEPLDADLFRYTIGDRAFEWHTYAWTRDSDGLWSLSIDGITEASNFREDLSITSFDYVELHLHRNQSEIEWVRISGNVVPAPGAFILGSIGLAFSSWKLRRRRTL